MIGIRSVLESKWFIILMHGVILLLYATSCDKIIMFMTSKMAGVSVSQGFK